LLDEHISRRVVPALRRKGVDVLGLREWREGSMLGADDEEILAVALPEGRSLVTYDLRTMPPLLRRLAEAGTQHAGVILISVKTVAQDDVRTLARLLAQLVETHQEGLENQAFFLER
jgi:predicted nuclease of predicted toxin-antitoxin system